jgi:hypothetical protein
MQKRMAPKRWGYAMATMGLLWTIGACGGGGEAPDARVAYETGSVPVDGGKAPGLDGRDVPTALDAEGGEGGRQDGGVDGMDGAGGDAPPVDAPFVDAPQVDAPMPAITDAGADSAGEGDAALDAPPWGTSPTVHGTVYTFRVGQAVFSVDAAKGGRIVEFSLVGRNLLTAEPESADAGDVNWGSTFWPSPQSDWNWPPPVEIDAEPYAVTVTDGLLILQSAPSATLGFSVTKTFSVDEAAGAMQIDYAFTNEGRTAKSVAPWEISRVAGGGLTFFPKGTGTPRAGSVALLDLRIAGGVAWLDYDATTATANSAQKVYADGAEGWLAHATGDLLFVKSFTDVTTTQAAPGEAEIELYTDAPHTYLELENQGVYARVRPGATATWRVRWFLRRLDPTVPVEVGSAELLAVVRALVGV